MSEFNEMIRAQLEALQKATQTGYAAGYNAGYAAGLAEAQRILDRTLKTVDVLLTVDTAS